MAEMEENSISSVVTDPPYGLKFMGKEWDHGIPGIPFWEAALRVAKPGAHLLAFGGTRTFHRLVCAIEDAGWVIRDCVMWIYGCLSEDTEILVDGQWEPYHKAIEGSHTLCYDKEHDTYSWQPIEKQVVYDYDETAYRIVSNETDQIVSRNHRCIIDRGHGWEFVFAEEAAREHEVCVPVLEDVQGLLEEVPGFQSVSGGAEQDLFPRVFGEINLSPSAWQTHANVQAKDDPYCLRSLREEGLETEFLATQSENSNMLTAVQWSVARERLVEARAQRAGSVDGEKPSVLSGENEWVEQSGMEGRGDLLQDAWQLQGREIHPLPCRLRQHGPQGRVRDGASDSGRTSDRSMPLAAGSSPSRRSQPGEQLSGQLGPICIEQRPQTVRASRHTTSNLARITPVHYRGKVWCIKVPTGAFVARRNGKVFVTGNSGFPKSLDVGKAIDKAAGATREIVGRRTDRAATPKQDIRGGNLMNGINGAIDCSAITAPSTNAAKQWQGWGTALKPAWEPIILARKPLVGTVAQNVQEHSTGALNIDGCRVGVESTIRKRGDSLSDSGWASVNRSPVGGSESGRWPANVLHDGSEEVLEAFAAFGEKKSCNSPSKTKCASKFRPEQGAYQPQGPIYLGDTGTAARFFYCAKASTSERNRGLDNPGSQFQHGVTLRQIENTATKGNTHATVKPLALMQYLCKLVTPPNGIVLDPFLGSGSTGVAALREGFNFVGIEINLEYLEIARARIEHQRNGGK